MLALIPSFTASGEGSDFTVNSAQVIFNAANFSVSVTLNQDNIALEPDETFVLELDSTGTLSPSFFIMDTINVTITDSDGKIQCCINYRNYTYCMIHRLTCNHTTVHILEMQVPT